MNDTLKASLAAIGVYACLAAVGWQFRDHPTIQRYLHQFGLTAQVTQPCPTAPNGLPYYGPAC
jgi:outer membrane lipopolysaccharide assembly protein LptE/RlpB